MYDRISDTDSANTSRKHLFPRNGRKMETTPTRDALEQHVKRVHYQAVFIETRALFSCSSVLTPHEWGWEIVNEK
jgi:hypothetical protein